MRFHPSRAALLVPNRRLVVPQSARRQRGFLGMAPGFLSGSGGGGGGSVGSNVKMWRIHITANNGSTSFVTVAEMQFRATSGGANLCTGGTPFASSQANTDNTSANAFDGNPSTKWTSASAPSVASPQFLGYALPTASQVNEIAVTGCITGQETLTPRDFTIQSSTNSTDGANGTWINEWSESGQTAWTGGETRIFTRTAHTGSTPWSGRLKITANNGNTHSVEVAELQFRATVGGASLCAGGFSNTNSFNDSHAPSDAFDGSSSTIWASLVAPTVASPAILAYVFPAASVIEEVAIIGCQTGDGTVALKDFVIQVSNNSTTGLDGDWADWLDVTGETGWVGGEMRTFTQP